MQHGPARRVFGHGGRAADHGQADATLGLFLVIALIALLGKAVLAGPGCVGRAHHPVADPQALDLKWL